MAGWNCRLAVDSWEDAVATHNLNSLDRPAVSKSIQDVDTGFLTSKVEGGIDWIVGGPPCQGWSTVGKRKWDDDRNDLFTEFVRIVRLVRPRNFLIENVVGLRDMKAASDVRELFSGTGYSVTFHTLKAADYGVPQLRHRVVFVGSLDGVEYLPPPPSHEEDDYVSVFDAIGDLPALAPGQSKTEYDAPPQSRFQSELRNGSKSIQGHTASKHPPHLVEAISHIPDGGNRSSIPKHLQPKSGFHNSYSRLASWRPSVAVTSNMGKPSATRCIHPFQNRGLTAREGARLQTFPDSFHFGGGIVSQRLQIANAVPPLLAQSLGNWLSAEVLPKEGSFGARAIAA